MYTGICLLLHSECIIAPSYSTSLPAVYPLKNSMTFRNSSIDRAFIPIVITELNPAPIPRNALPPDSSFTVAVPLAVTDGCRVNGFVTPCPMWILCVFTAATVIIEYTSRHRFCESIRVICLNPQSSATWA